MSTDAARHKILYNSHGPESFYDMIRDVAGPRFEILTLDEDDECERIAKVAKAEGIIVAATPLKAPVLEAADCLRIVHHQGVGYHDTIDLDALCKTRAALAINPVGTTIGVAEHAVLLTLATLRRLPFADAELRQGRWHINSLRLESGELAGRTVGYVGMGRIAQAAAARFRAFDAKGVYFDPMAQLDPSSEAELGVRAVDFDTLLSEADIITLHLPLTEQSHHMIDAGALARMKPGAILINTARGPIVDEAALISAIGSGHLGGAGLDVFEEEPPRDTPLATFRNVVLTPHISAGTRDALEAKMAALFENLEGFFAGRPLRNAVSLAEPVPE